jgi:hypothetical protein
MLQWAVTMAAFAPHMGPKPLSINEERPFAVVAMRLPLQLTLPLAGV